MKKLQISQSKTQLHHHLTMEVDGKMTKKTIAEWIEENPKLLLDASLGKDKRYSFRLERSVYYKLKEKLENENS